MTSAAPWTTTASGSPDVMSSAKTKVVETVSSSARRGTFTGSSSARITKTAKPMASGVRSAPRGIERASEANSARPTTVTAATNACSAG